MRTTDAHTYGPQTAMVEALIDRMGRLTARECRKIRQEGSWLGIRTAKASADRRAQTDDALDAIKHASWDVSYDRSLSVESARDVARNMPLRSDYTRDLWAVRGAAMCAAEATAVLDLAGGRLSRDHLRTLWAPMAAAIGWPAQIANEGEKIWNWETAE